MMQQKNMKNQESDEREKNIFSHLEIEFFQSQNDQMAKNSYIILKRLLVL